MNTETILERLLELGPAELRNLSGPGLLDALNLLEHAEDRTQASTPAARALRVRIEVARASIRGELERRRRGGQPGPPCCELCGGDAGVLLAGRHVLCAARKLHGLETPNLGKRCRRCRGSGHLPRSSTGPMLDLSLGPGRIANAISAWAPACPDCDGKGSIHAS